jgi:very-short-patch-repair endonuclease
VGTKVANPEVFVAKIATRQHGLVSLGQLLDLGLSEKAVRGRVAGGRLHRVHRGVYAVGHVALAPHGRWLAAVLAVGGGPHEDEPYILDHWGAAVSHRSAAALWGLLSVKDEPCHVAVQGTSGRKRRAGIRVHRSISLTASDVTQRHGIPVTTPARTIADLRHALATGRPRAVSGRELRRAVRQANVLGLPIDEEDRADRTRGDLEGAFLTICRHHRLPRPEVNVRIGPYLVDFLWREERLAVETDSYLHHRGRAAFQDDRGRELELMRLGYHVLRLSEAQIKEKPADVGEIVDAELRRRRAG